jgi:regulator of protease activity HflC (stomatin/prohibitin superfamily)
MEDLIGALVRAFIVLGAGLKLDREYQRGMIFRLGRAKGVMGPRLYWIIPGIDQKVQVDVRTRTTNIEPQEAVTADSVTIRVNSR